MILQALNAFFLWREITFQYFCSSITTAGAKTISIWLVLWLEGTNPPGGETRNPQLRQDYRIIPSMSQNCLKFWDKFETKLRTDLRPYRDNLETYLTILLLRANWDIFETWVHSECLPHRLTLLEHVSLWGRHFSTTSTSGVHCSSNRKLPNDIGGGDVPLDRVWFSRSSILTQDI